MAKEKPPTQSPATNKKSATPVTAAETCSWSATELIKGSHLYRVKDLSLLQGIGPGKHKSSHKFTVGDYNWVILFYPDGEDPKYKSKYTSAYIKLTTKVVNDVKALFGLTLLDQSGNENHIEYHNVNHIPPGGPYTFNDDTRRGYPRLFKKSKLNKAVYIKDDFLELHCTIAVAKDTISEPPPNLLINVPPANLGSCLRGILDSGIGSDVGFEVEGEMFKAHKNILAARSPVFSAQFFGQIENPSPARLFSNMTIQFAQYDEYPHIILRRHLTLDWFQRPCPSTQKQLHTPYAGIILIRF